MMDALDPNLIEFPNISLSGLVDHSMYLYFSSCLGQLPQSGTCTIALSTLGGDPEIARVMGEDVRFHSDLHPDRRIVFIGKAAVYSAGATFMGFFAVPNRFLTRGTRLMVHERIIQRTITLEGPLTTCRAPLRAALNEIEASIAIQNEGFQNLVLGSNVSVEQLQEKASENWYLEAQEAKALGLVADII